MTLNRFQEKVQQLISASEVTSLKNILSELNLLMVNSPKNWAAELTRWAIQTISKVGQSLKHSNKYPNTGLIETTQFWIDQEIPSKLSNLIVSGILYDLECDRCDGVDFFMREVNASYKCSANSTLDV